MSFKILIGIGDIHGCYAEMNQLMEVLDSEYHIFSHDGLIRPDVGIEYNGDLIDRGPNSLEVVEYVKNLCEQNHSVKAKPGNHELLALADLDTARAIHKNIENNPSIAFELYASNSMHGKNGGTQTIQSFGYEPQEAFHNYIKRMSRHGDIGKWIRELDPYSIRHISGRRILFTHSDIPDEITGSLEDCAEQYKRMTETISSLFAGGVKNKYSPTNTLIKNLFWGRKYATMDESYSYNLINKLGVDYIVVGHTPQANGISRKGSIFFIDTGMCFGREPAAIIFDDSGIYAHYIRRGKEMLAKY